MLLRRILGGPCPACGKRAREMDRHYVSYHWPDGIGSRRHVQGPCAGDATNSRPVRSNEPKAVGTNVDGRLPRLTGGIHVTGLYATVVRSVTPPDRPTALTPRSEI